MKRSCLSPKGRQRALDLVRGRHFHQRSLEQRGYQSSDQFVVAVVLDHAHQAHHRILAIDGLARAIEARRIHPIRPVHELVEVGLTHAEVAIGDVGDELGARAVLGVEEEAAAAAPLFEVLSIGGRCEGRAVVIEIPGQARGRRVAVVEDCVFLPIEHAVVGAQLARAIAATPINQLPRCAVRSATAGG